MAGDDAVRTAPVTAITEFLANRGAEEAADGFIAGGE